MNYFAGEYDVAVVGAGHAGIEAALAAASPASAAAASPLVDAPRRVYQSP